ncbi:MAG: hypothetical protein II875_03750 [Clostridia bacterium]|nr:hypothetical protein [Clostridia bacterium]
MAYRNRSAGFHGHVYGARPPHPGKIRGYTEKQLEAAGSQPRKKAQIHTVYALSRLLPSYEEALADCHEKMKRAAFALNMLFRV